MNIQQKNKGFTIIEVVLVLAIAGLIFMMVFIALPSLQRSQRDSSRKSDLSRAMTAVANYTANNRGSLPTFDDNFISAYLTVGTDSFVDPSGANTSQGDRKIYEFKNADIARPVLPGAFDHEVNQNVIYYTKGAVCGDGGEVASAGTRKVALRMYVEGGGITCQNN